MTRVYLDTSIYNRPFDDQTQPKIFLETQAVILILQMIEFGLIELIVSSVLEYENRQNPFPSKQYTISQYIEMAKFRQEVNDAIRQRGEELERQGVKPIDALHVACAEAVNSDYFITCDKRLINRCRALGIEALNPVDFIIEVENDYQSN